MMQRATFFLILIWSDKGKQQTTDPYPYMHGMVPLQSHKLTSDEEVNRQKDLLMVAAADVIHGTNPMVWRTAEIRDKSSQCASFEIGFVMRTMEESYKKMLDIYNTTVQMGTKNSNRGQIHYLQRVEKLHWEVEQLSNMMHEIERKYKMNSLINASGMFEDGKRWTPSTTTKPGVTAYIEKMTTSWWYPLEYGFKPGDYYNWR